MTAPGVSTSARDINIDLADSCNCRCFSWRHRPNRPMFITKSGDAVPFDPRRAADERRAMQLTIERLLEKIDEVAIAASCNREGLQGLIEGRLGTKLKVDPPTPTTLNTIEVINDAIKGIII